MFARERRITYRVESTINSMLLMSNGRPSIYDTEVIVNREGSRNRLCGFYVRKRARCEHRTPLGAER